MEINAGTAQSIVANLKDVIHHEINLFDTNGMIIASTDRSRIGTGHDGARLAVRIKQTVSIDDDHQFEGARNGINVPVLFDDSVVAVIGITGERTEVEPFGNVIKKMTEILIRESLEQMTRFDQRLMMTNLVTMLTQPRRDDGMVAYLASTLELDLKRPRRAVVGRLEDDGGTNDAAPADIAVAYDMLYPTLQRHLAALPRTLYSASTRECCLFIDAEDAADPAPALEAIQADIARTLHRRMRFGVGGIAAHGDDYHVSYDQAHTGLDWQRFTGNDGIGRYEDLDLGVLIAATPPDVADRFVDRIFAGLDEERIEDSQATFDAYTRHNGSIVHAAEELFLHKNTLQNRLNRIARDTGYNPRELADYAILALAFRLRAYRRFRNQAASGEH